MEEYMNEIWMGRMGKLPVLQIDDG